MTCVLRKELNLSCILLNPYFYNYPEIEIPISPNTAHITLVVNLDDDLINPEAVVERFSGHATIVTAEKGGTGFADKGPIVEAVRASLR
jgi:hypothetical protein